MRWMTIGRTKERFHQLKNPTLTSGYTPLLLRRLSIQLMRQNSLSRLRLGQKKLLGGLLLLQRLLCSLRQGFLCATEDKLPKLNTLSLDRLKSQARGFQVNLILSCD
jgi:hypothetical protein